MSSGNDFILFTVHHIQVVACNDSGLWGTSILDMLHRYSTVRSITIHFLPRCHLMKSVETRGVSSGSPYYWNFLVRVRHF